MRAQKPREGVGYGAAVLGRVVRGAPWIAVGAGLITVGALLAPWARSGRVDRSSIELLASASALDLLSGTERVVLVGSWFLVTATVAGALVAVAWGRRRLAASLVVPLGPVMVLAAVAVASSPFSLRWGAPMGSVSGLTATVAGALVLMDRHGGEAA